MIGDGARQSDNLRYLVLGEHAHLQIEIGMLAVSLCHTIMADGDEGRQKMASTEAADVLPLVGSWEVRSAISTSGGKQ